MTSRLKEMEELFRLFIHCRIEEYAYSKGKLRLKFNTSLAKYLSSDFTHINLVIKGCENLSYHSYTASVQHRVKWDPQEIFQVGLEPRFIQRINSRFIIYCNSYFRVVEAGELHFKAQDYDLYDQEFGKVGYEQLIGLLHIKNI
jgi:hypothetical protein